MSEPAPPEDVLRTAGALGHAPLAIAETALAFAALDRPGVPLERYLGDLARLSGAVGERVAALPAGADAAAKSACLASVISEDFAFRGDSATYDDLQNANLMRVMDRRKGLPVALGILYIHAARGQGWQAEGLNFPNHFLIRVTVEGARTILDPFNGGRLMTASDLRALIQDMTQGRGTLTPEATDAVSDRQVLLRLQNNIKLRLYRSQKLEAALKVIDRMLLLAPDESDLKREAGLVNARLGNLRAAMQHLQAFLDDGAGSAVDRHEAARMLQSLSARLN